MCANACNVNVVFAGLLHSFGPSRLPIHNGSDPRYLPECLLTLIHRRSTVRHQMILTLRPSCTNNICLIPGPLALNPHYLDTKLVIMKTNIREFLNDRIDILNRKAVDVPPAWQVLKTTSDILTLVRVSALVFIRQRRFSLAAQQGQDNWQQRFRATVRILFRRMCGAGDLNQGKKCGRPRRTWKHGTQGSGKVCRLPQLRLLIILSNFRLICEIERTLRRGTNTPNTKYNKEKVEEHKLEIQGILGILDSRVSPLDGNLGAIRSITPVSLVASGSTAAPSAAESGMSSVSAPARATTSHGVLGFL